MVVSVSEKLLKTLISTQQESHERQIKILQDMDDKVDSLARILKGETDTPEAGLISRVRSLENFRDTAKTWAFRILGLSVLGGGGTGAAWLTTAQKTVENVASGKLPGTH